MKKRNPALVAGWGALILIAGLAVLNLLGKQELRQGTEFRKAIIDYYNQSGFPLDSACKIISADYNPVSNDSIFHTFNPKAVPQYQSLRISSRKGESAHYLKPLSILVSSIPFFSYQYM